MQALEVHERGIHSRCGQHLVFSTDPDARGHFEQQSKTCHACAAMEQADAKRGDKQPAPGTVSWVDPDAALARAIEIPLPAQYGGVKPRSTPEGGPDL